MEIHTILAPVDFSEHSNAALDWALTLATPWRAHVLMLHVVSLPTDPPLIMETSVNLSDLEAALKAEAEARARTLLEQMKNRTVPIEVRVILGQPFSDICRIATEEKADLIVMGSHGRGGLSRALLGSVAERVVRHASCPVLVVKKGAPA